MKKVVLLVFALVFLHGCSSKLAYNNLDWLVYWYLDDYVELNDAQEAIFDDHLNSWIHWHRSQELQRYVLQLKELRQDIQKDALSEQRILWHMKMATEHWARLRDELSPELASMALTLSDEQVVRLFAALEKDNQEEEEEWEENQSKTPEQRMEDRREEFYDEFRERLGSLTDDQKQIINQYAPKFVSTHKDWIAYRRNIQSAARRMFAARSQDPGFTEKLQQLMMHPEAFRDLQYQEARLMNNEWYAQMAAQIAGSLTDRQKSKLIEEINDIIRDLEDLLDDD